MGKTVGIVIPAYKPDVSRLVTYASSLLYEIDSAKVHIELDDPTGEVDFGSTSLPEAISVNTESRRRGKGAAITHGFEALDTEYLGTEVHRFRPSETYLTGSRALACVWGLDGILTPSSKPTRPFSDGFWETGLLGVPANSLLCNSPTTSVG
jgi:hypothetical protein